MSQPPPQARRTLARQAAPPGIYASKYDPRLGAQICRRIAAGESLRSICRADASMPTEKTVWNWARAHAEFAQMKAHAFSVARARSLAARDAALTRRAAPPPPPSRPARIAWNEGLDGYFLDHPRAWRVIDALLQGRPLTEVCREAWAPCVGTFYNWLKRYPELRTAYAEAKAIAGEVMVETAREDAPWLETEAASERNLRRAVRAAERRAAQLATVRYAEPTGPRELIVEALAPGQAEGEGTVIYSGRVPPPPPG